MKHRTQTEAAQGYRQEQLVDTDRNRTECRQEQYRLQTGAAQDKHGYRHETQDTDRSSEGIQIDQLRDTHRSNIGIPIGSSTGTQTEVT